MTIDSDFVLKKAIRRAIHQSYYSGDEEVTLRLLVIYQTQLASTNIMPSTFLQQYQCIECGGHFLKDTRFAYPQGDQPICNSCFAAIR